jgi:hypothetical protein
MWTIGDGHPASDRWSPTAQMYVAQARRQSGISCFAESSAVTRRRGHDWRVPLRPKTADPDSWTREPDPLLALALHDLAFYERTRDMARRWHYITEVTALVSASATVMAAGLGAPALVTALAAAITLLTNGIRQVFNPAGRWELAASGWVYLWRAVTRYRLLPEEQRDQAAREQLQNRIEEVGEKEIREWITQRREARGTTVGNVET